MYKFSLKDNGSGLDITVTRALLALAGFAAFAVQTHDHYYLNVIAGILLLLLAAFIRLILIRSKINQLVLLIVAALLLFMATSSLMFGVILLLFGLSFTLFYKPPFVEIITPGVKTVKTFSTHIDPWSKFNNVILKDGLLTLDFKNNRLIQLAIDNTSSTVDENAFNEFCARLVGSFKELTL